MVHERKETERRREDSSHSTVRGSTGPTPQTSTHPQLTHRSSLRGLVSDSGRSDSPTALSDDERAKLRKPRLPGLGRVLQDDAQSVGTSSSGIGFPRSATMSSTASASRFSHQLQASPSRRSVPDRHRAVSEAYSLAPTEGGEPKRKKPGFFSRFGRKKDRSGAPVPPLPLPNSPSNARGQESNYEAMRPHSPLPDMTPPRGGTAPTAPAPEKIRFVKVSKEPECLTRFDSPRGQSAEEVLGPERSRRKANPTRTLVASSSRKNSSLRRRNDLRSLPPATTSRSTPP